MPQRAASADRRVLGRNSRSELRLRLLTLLLWTLFAFPAIVVAFATWEAQAVLAAVVAAAIWLVACSRALGTGGAVAFDRAGVEVKTILKTWQYPWTDILAVRWELVAARWGPSPVRVIQRLELRQRADGPPSLVARMTGGAGRLPMLDPDEIDALQEALAAHRLAPIENEASTDGAGVMKMLLGRCAELGNLRDVIKVGTLASIDLADYETTGSKVRVSIEAGDWAVAASIREGTAGSDWVFWYVLERTDGRGAVVEIVHYIELYFNEETSLIRTLTTYDLDRCRPCVTDWVGLGDNCAAGV